MTAFMLQQAAELITRGLITALSANCVKTHYFNELKKPLKQYLPALDYIISKSEAEEERRRTFYRKPVLNLDIHFSSP